MNSAPRILGKLCLSALVFALALVAAEIGHRLWFYGPPGLSPRRLASAVPFGEAELTRDAGDASIGYELRANLHAWHLLHPFETNSQGLRDQEYALEKPPGTFRIAVVGDSYTMGQGVPIESVFHSVVERRLNEGPSGRRFELVNFGVAGYSLLHELAVIERRVPAWDPDLILLAVISNDAPPPSIAYLRKLFPDHPGIAPVGDRRRAPPAPSSYWRFTLFDRFRGLSPDPAEEERERPAPGQPRVSRDELAVRAVLGSDAELSGEERYLPVVFERLRQVSADTDVPILCVYLAGSASEAMRAAAREFEQAAADAGLGFLDTCELLVGLDYDDIAVLPDDGHPNARVHALYAGAIERELVEGGWLEPE